MRRLRFDTSASVVVEATTELAWAWIDRLPEALTEFSFVHEVRSTGQPGTYALVLRPVSYGKVTLALELEMLAARAVGRELRMTSLPARGNADAEVRVGIAATDDASRCILTITLEVSPHKPAAAYWPRELIEKATSASLSLAARKMLADMKVAIEGGAAAALLHTPRTARLAPESPGPVRP